MLTRRRAAIASLLAVAATVAIAAPAGASSTVSLTSLRFGNLSVSSGACREIPVTATHSGSGLDVEIRPEVWRGSTYVDDVWLFDSDGTGAAHDTWYWCPYLDGLGTFRGGPSEIDWSDWATGDSGTARASLTTTFYVKQASGLTLSTSRSGRYVSLSSKASYYSVSASSWQPRAGATVRLQRRPLGSSTWYDVGTAKTGRLGYATFRVDQSTAREWRTLVGATSATWGRTSATRTR